MSGRRNRPESRNVAAFNALLAPDEDEDTAPSSASRRRRPSGGGGKGRADRGRPVQLREQQQEGGGLRQLQDLFGEAFPLDVIADVYNACSTTEEAIDALLSLSGASQASAVEGHTQSAAPADPAAAAAPRLPPCYWDWLPEECKLLVLGRLSVRDLARAAGTCSELARHVREQRQRMRTVTLPEGISMRAVRGAVAAFSRAPTVCFSRWAPHLRFPNQFEDIFDAVALGEFDRTSGVPVRHVDLSRCGGLTDGDVGMLCSRLRHLESIDLSGCTQVSDDSLGPLSRYITEAPDDSSCFADGLAADLAAGLELVDDDIEPEAGGGSGSHGDSGTAQLHSPRAAVKRIAAAKEAARQAALEAAAARATLPAGTGGGLKQLRLRDTGITTSGLRALLQGSGAGAGSAAFKSLLLLDVSSCRGIGSEGFTLGPQSALCTLRATGCLRLRSVVMQLPGGTLLEEVDLSSCRQLHEVVLVAPHLRRLTLSHCGVLSSLVLRCRALEELRCVNCSRLPALGPEFDCPSLRHLDLFGCRLLDSEGLEAAGASFERLEWLNLGGCTCLSRLVLAELAPRLVTAIITGCGAVRQVVLGSPMLRSLTAKACERLLEVRLHSVALKELDLENCGSLRDVDLPAQPNSPRSTAAGDQGGGRLVLKGCAGLSPAARRQLSAALRQF